MGNELFYFLKFIEKPKKDQRELLAILKKILGGMHDHVLHNYDLNVGQQAELSITKDILKLYDIRKTLESIYKVLDLSRGVIVEYKEYEKETYRRSPLIISLSKDDKAISIQINSVVALKLAGMNIDTLNHKKNKQITVNLKNFSIPIRVDLKEKCFLVKYPLDVELSEVAVVLTQIVQEIDELINGNETNGCHPADIFHGETSCYLTLDRKPNY